MTILSMGGTSPVSKKPPKVAEPKPAKAVKPVHPGLETSTRRDEAWCRKCGTPVEFREVWGDTLRLGFCECGLWVRDRRDFVRFLRFDTDSYMIGQGPMFYSKKKGESE